MDGYSIRETAYRLQSLYETGKYDSVVEYFQESFQSAWQNCDEEKKDKLHEIMGNLSPKALAYLKEKLPILWVGDLDIATSLALYEYDQKVLKLQEANRKMENEKKWRVLAEDSQGERVSKSAGVSAGKGADVSTDVGTGKHNHDEPDALQFLNPDIAHCDIDSIYEIDPEYTEDNKNIYDIISRISWNNDDPKDKRLPSLQPQPPPEEHETLKMEFFKSQMDENYFVSELKMFLCKVKPALQKREGDYSMLHVLLTPEDQYVYSKASKVVDWKNKKGLFQLALALGIQVDEVKEFRTLMRWDSPRLPHTRAHVCELYLQIKREVLKAAIPKWRAEASEEDDLYECKSSSSESHDQTYSVCDNLLYFKIALDAYCGYNPEVSFDFAEKGQYHGQCAIMGSAILAALTVTNVSLECRSCYEKLDTFLNSLDSSKILSDSKARNEMLLKYVLLRGEIVDTLREFFLSEKSLYSSGDVDIFLMHHKTNGKLAQLQEFSSAGMKNLRPIFEKDALELGRQQFGWNFCLSDNVLSMYFAIGNADYRDKHYRDIPRWPRTTQMIELDKKADLNGALMDFDIDCCGFMYDGKTVRALPRAVQACATNTILCRPGILQHTRNRSRVRKYVGRGFTACLFDPLYRSSLDPLFHSSLGRFEDPYAEFKTLFELKFQNELDNIALYRALHNYYIMNYGFHNVHIEAFDRNMILTRSGPYIGNTVNACCLPGQRSFNDDYNVLLFEKYLGHAKMYFSKLHNWSTDQMDAVNEVESKYRVACKSCREQYLLSHFPDLQLSTKDEEIGDIATDFGAIRLSSGGYNFVRFKPWWYDGGALPKGRFLDYNNDRIGYTLYQVKARLQAQHRAEETRHIRDTGSLEGYKTRFVHAGQISDLFDLAKETDFRTPARPPIGLNPERFVVECRLCSCYIYRAGYCDAKKNVVCSKCAARNVKRKHESSSSSSSSEMKTKEAKK